MTEDIILDLISSNLIYLLLALLVIIVIFKGVKIVPQSEQHVIERFGRLHKVLGPGINLIVPFLDVVRHKISILERQLPTASNSLPAPRCRCRNCHHRGRDRARRDW